MPHQAVRRLGEVDRPGGLSYGELRSPGKLKHAPPMRRSRLEMAKLQGRATLASGLWPFGSHALV